jgi:hypothetical protein
LNWVVVVFAVSQTLEVAPQLSRGLLILGGGAAATIILLGGMSAQVRKHEPR